MNKLSVFVIFLMVSLPIYAFEIDSVGVYSRKMQRSIDVMIISPDKEKLSSCPVLFLLHGYSGDAKTWMKINPGIANLSDKDGIIVVCPDGENSWYWDSPINPDSQFETFITEELVSYVDSCYNTVKSRSGRAITGLSMGGHGALWLAFRYKDLFGAAGSMSGGVDIRPFPNSWEMKKQIGAKAENPERWNDYTVINQLDSIDNGDLSIIIDCGINDFFLEVNNTLHDKLIKHGVNHDYIVRPGEHNSSYWRNAIEYQWLFFKKFFSGYRFSD